MCECALFQNMSTRDASSEQPTVSCGDKDIQFKVSELDCNNEESGGENEGEEPVKNYVSLSDFYGGKFDDNEDEDSEEDDDYDSEDADDDEEDDVEESDAELDEDNDKGIVSASVAAVNVATGTAAAGDVKAGTECSTTSSSSHDRKRKAEEL